MNDDLERSLPFRTQRTPRQTAIAVGIGQVCALHAQGTVNCVGQEMGDDMHFREPKPPPLDDAVALDAFGHMMCALRRGGRIACWGQVGRPRTATGVVEIGAGLRIFCLRSGDGNVRCEDDLSDAVQGPLPPAVSGPLDAISLDVGSEFGCVIRGSGEVACSGGNEKGELALDPRVTRSSQWTTVRSLPKVVQLAAGNAHACVATADGRAFCWGSSVAAQLGDGVKAPVRRTPIEVPGLRNVRAVAAGEEHSCALTDDDEVYCWGNNGWGQLGNGTTEPSGAPQRVYEAARE